MSPDNKNGSIYFSRLDELVQECIELTKTTDYFLGVDYETNGRGDNSNWEIGIVYRFKNKQTEEELVRKETLAMENKGNEKKQMEERREEFFDKLRKNELAVGPSDNGPLYPFEITTRERDIMESYYEHIRKRGY